MKLTRYTLILLLASCSGQTNNTSISSHDTIAAEREDSLTNAKTTPIVGIDEVDVLPPDSLFLELNLELQELTEKEYARYEKANHKTCPIDSTGFIAGYGVSVTTECNEICITDLIDTESGKMLQLPCSYDQGILGLSFSPSCRQFAHYSSYDSPDFEQYSAYRSEIFGYTVANGEGLTGIKPKFKYRTKDWSIAAMTWIDDKTVAFKVYKDGTPSKGNGFTYHYFKAELLL